jgi:ABC-type Mn2+/Zn2+ transport system permease subunit
MDILGNILISALFISLTAISLWRFLHRCHPEKWFHLAYSFGFLAVSIGIWFCSIVTISGGIFLIVVLCLQNIIQFIFEKKPNLLSELPAYYG